jgi:hypothetical protein
MAFHDQCTCTVLLAAMPMETVEASSPDELFRKVWETAAGEIKPAFGVDGTTFIETDSFLCYTGMRKLLISKVAQVMEIDLSKHVTLVFYPLTRGMRQRFGIPRTAYHFVPTESWTNPNLIRPALLEILQACKVSQNRAA